MIREAISTVVGGASLTVNEAASVMEEIMAGDATPAQIGAFATALRLKGETSEEITGMARVMRTNVLKVEYPGPMVDIVGTGGDGLNTFNLSTAAELVLAASGVKVAKHGNRAASSAAGAADVLEACGVKLELAPEEVAHCIDEAGMGFMFAPAFHPAMRHAGGPRREIGIRTVFNILGPLTNPAGAESLVVGIADPSLGERMAHAFAPLEGLAVCRLRESRGQHRAKVLALKHLGDELEAVELHVGGQLALHCLGARIVGRVHRAVTVEPEHTLIKHDTQRFREHDKRLWFRWDIVGCLGPDRAAALHRRFGVVAFGLGLVGCVCHVVGTGLFDL